jgi:hypothetical protein
MFGLNKRKRLVESMFPKKVLLTAVLLCSLAACSGGSSSRSSGNGGNSNSGSSLNGNRIEGIFRRVFPGARTIDSRQISQCSFNTANYEAYVSYELYDNLYGSYRTLSAWFLFWPPYDENSFFEGRCN